MKKRKTEKRGRQKYCHSKQRLPQDFVWKLLQKVHDDTFELASSVGLESESVHLQYLIRTRNVSGYIAACSERWSLTQLSQCIVDDDVSTSLTKIRVLRLFTIGKKHDFPNSPFDQKGSALKKFIEYEQKCSVTNNDALFFEALSDEENPALSHADALFHWPVLNRAREFISMVLGDDYDEQDLLEFSHHGPGASVGCRGRRSIPVGKYLPPFISTDLATDLFDKWIRRDERWVAAMMSSGLKFCHENIDAATILFVPKNAKTLRTIMVEATGNVALQLGVDRIIRKRLRRFGIDLNTQEKNQKLASLYSKTGEGVTVDLSGASDTVALAWLTLFPPKWAELLYALRTPRGVTEDGDEFLFEKLSSMGNGTTFVIESLIFAAILYGTIREEGSRWADFIDQISVYGDDIILPTRFYPRYAASLRRFGFRINASKSFSTGPIRESCGADFFKGFDISVFNLKSKISDHHDLNHIHNSLFSVENRFGFDLTLSRCFVEERISKESRSYGPPSEETGAYLFTNTQSAMNIYFSKRYQAHFCRINIVKKVRPPLHQPLQKVFSKEVVDFLPLVDYLQTDRSTDDHWKDRYPWFDRIGVFMYYRGPGERYMPVRLKAPTSSQIREEVLRALFDKRAYALRTAVVSRPIRLDLSAPELLVV